MDNPTNITVFKGEDELFNGNVEQFQDCFFSNFSVSEVVQWAIDNHFTVIFKFNR